MNKAFEKILERFDKEIPIYTGKAKQIVQEVAEEYKKETYFNLDNVTLHKCPKCGGNAQHRVNQRGSWACGCFECGLFKSDYDHQKAIQEWEDYCKEYNGGWIPCSERLPEESGYYLVTYHDWSDGNFLPKYNDTYVRRLHYQISEHFVGWNYPKNVDDRAENDCHKEVIAWQPLPESFKERD